MEECVDATVKLPEYMRRGRGQDTTTSRMGGLVLHTFCQWVGASNFNATPPSHEVSSILFWAFRAGFTNSHEGTDRIGFINSPTTLWLVDIHFPPSLMSHPMSTVTYPPSTRRLGRTLSMRESLSALRQRHLPYLKYDKPLTVN
jgi:hypothetical protein